MPFSISSSWVNRLHSVFSARTANCFRRASRALSSSFFCPPCFRPRHRRSFFSFLSCSLNSSLICLRIFRCALISNSLIFFSAASSFTPASALLTNFWVALRPSWNHDASVEANHARVAPNTFPLVMFSGLSPPISMMQSIGGTSQFNSFSSSSFSTFCHWTSFLNVLTARDKSLSGSSKTGFQSSSPTFEDKANGFRGGASDGIAPAVSPARCANTASSPFGDKSLKTSSPFARCHASRSRFSYALSTH